MRHDLFLFLSPPILFPLVRHPAPMTYNPAERSDAADQESPYLKDVLGAPGTTRCTAQLFSSRTCEGSSTCRSDRFEYANITCCLQPYPRVTAACPLTRWITWISAQAASLHSARKSLVLKEKSPATPCLGGVTPHLQNNAPIDALYRRLHFRDLPRLQSFTGPRR